MFNFRFNSGNIIKKFVIFNLFLLLINYYYYYLLFLKNKYKNNDFFFIKLYKKDFNFISKELESKYSYKNNIKKSDLNSNNNNSIFF